MSKRELVEVKEKIRVITQQLIRELRAGEHLTQTELAQRVGINRSLISQYESGDREPSLLSLVKLADYAHVSVDYLLGREVNYKYKLTRPEEQFVKVWRKMPPGHEVTMRKEQSMEEELHERREHSKEKDQKDSQIVVKKDVKI